MVFCEGVVSEPDYLNGLKRLPEIRGNIAVSVEIDPEQGVPLTLVNMAIDRLHDDEVDECWCVFDVEWPQHHPHLKKAIALAREHGVSVAVSNPCFEMWLLLHFEYQTRSMTTADAVRRSRHFDGRRGKRIDPSVYLPHRRTAARRAVDLKKRHLRNRTPFPQDNPSSTMSDLLAAIENPQEVSGCDLDPGH